MTTGSNDLQVEAAATRIGLPRAEYRLLLHSALIGIAGGLGAQLFVWILNLAESLLLVGIASHRPPEPGTLNPVPIVGAWGLWLIPLATMLAVSCPGNNRFNSRAASFDSRGEISC